VRFDPTEYRVTNAETGGAKGQKSARFDLIPAGPLRSLAEHYGHSCDKYEDRNWEKGYAWSLSFAALNRHLWAFWAGEDIDHESEHGAHHLDAVMFHVMALRQFAEQDRYAALDDRPLESAHRPPEWQGAADL